MKTIFNNLIINLDSLIDIEGLVSMRPKISALIALNKKHHKPVKYWSEGLYDRSLLGIYDIQQNIQLDQVDPEQAKLIERLIAEDEFGSYIIYEQDNLAQGSYSFHLRYSLNFLERLEKDKCVKLPYDCEFDFFYQWLEQQNIFSDYGRVNFFLTPKGVHTDIHKDYSMFEEQHPEHFPGEFIHLVFNDRKKFFLIDEVTGEKTYLHGYCNWFDHRNWHGSDIANDSCYSLKIEGKFTEEFREKIKSLVGAP